MLYSTVSVEENHTESENHSGLKGPWQIPSQPLFRTDRLLRASACQVLKTSMDGDCTTSLGNLSNTWLLHTEKVFSWVQLETSLLQFMTVVSCPPTMQHCGAWLHLLSNLLAGTGRQLSGLCEVISMPNKPLFTWQVLQPPGILGALHWTHSSLPMPSSCLGMENTTGVVLQMQQRWTHTSLDLLALLLSTDIYAILHYFSRYYLLAIFLFKTSTASSPLTLHVATALLIVPGNLSTIVRGQCISCWDRGGTVCSPKFYMHTLENKNCKHI